MAKDIDIKNEFVHVLIKKYKVKEMLKKKKIVEVSIDINFFNLIISATIGFLFYHG